MRSERLRRQLREDPFLRHGARKAYTPRNPPMRGAADPVQVSDLNLSLLIARIRFLLRLDVMFGPCKAERHLSTVRETDNGLEVAQAVMAPRIAICRPRSEIGAPTPRDECPPRVRLATFAPSRRMPAKGPICVSARHADERPLFALGLNRSRGRGGERPGELAMG
jgi:hypothetical protein